MIWIYIALIVSGMAILWLASKIYCFKNKEEWEKFKKQYNKRKS